MIIYLAGNGFRAENIPELLERKSNDWGVLLSYKDMQNTNNDGGTRFKRIKKMKK